ETRIRRGALAFDIPNTIARPLIAGDLRLLAVRGPGPLCVAPWTRAASVLHAIHHDRLRHATRLEADRIWHRDRLCLCRAGLERERRLLPDASRPPNRC